MIDNIYSDLIANLIFTLLIIGVGWILHYLTERRKLLSFFNISSSKRLVIYLSNIRVISGGSIGTDNLQRGYQGTTVVLNELLTANKFKEKFNYLAPALSESPKFLSKILFADIKVTIVPSVLHSGDIENQTTIISLGSPGYNIVSGEIEKDTKSRVRFTNDNSRITVTNIPEISDVDNGFIQRIVDKKRGRSTFYAAGLTEKGTVGAATFLTTNWKQLNKKYSNDKSFIIMLRFSTDSFDNWTIDFENELS
jgi:hypothetical protein